jgi:disulfide bond formation protein DsbB
MDTHTQKTALYSTSQGRVLIAGLVSFAMLITGFIFQYGFSLEPCTLCLWQRWPHALAFPLAIVAYTQYEKPMAGIALILGAFLLFVGILISGFHTGVEIGVWQGLSSCGSHIDTTLTPQELYAQVSNDQIADCSKPAWTFLGQSMTNWNLLISSVLFGIWAGTAWKRIML